MAYTYKDVLAAPRYKEMSDADKRLAEQYPDAGMAILSAKDAYGNASTPEGRAEANRKAEAVRQSYGGYTGGANGGYFNLSPISPRSYNDQYREGIDAILGDMQQKQKQLQNFRYDPNRDPAYQAYRKEYLREGNRAIQDTMGTYAAMTGGVPSSYAVTAAGQMGSYYNSQLTDKIPELYRDAYNRAMDEIQMQGNTAKLMMQQSDTGYNRLLDEISNQRMVRDEESQARQEDFNRAQVAAQYGDYSQLEGYGINTQMAKALQAANFGDYSMLQALGVDTSNAEFEKQLSIAQIAAAYGDFSLLKDLMAGRGANILAGAPAGSGSGGGNYSYNPTPTYNPTPSAATGGLSAETIEKARERQAGGTTVTNQAPVYPLSGNYPATSGISEDDLDAILTYNAQNNGKSGFNRGR